MTNYKEKTSTRIELRWLYKACQKWNLVYIVLENTFLLLLIAGLFVLPSLLNVNNGCCGGDYDMSLL